MRIYFRWFFSLSMALLLAGCATHLSKAQCLSTNWYQMGLTAGRNGQRVNVNSAVQDCAKYHIHVNTNAYIRGWNAGVKRFCTYQRGYRLGSTGQANPRICPAGNLQQRFDQGFHRGARVFCRRSSNGFALGREGKAFPPACRSAEFLAFDTSYQRGRAIYNRVSSIRREANNINGRINELVEHYGFRQRVDGFYKLGHERRKQTQKAQFRLEQVNHMVRERNRLQSQTFRASVID